eukprot:gene4180-8316_t
MNLTIHLLFLIALTALSHCRADLNEKPTPWDEQISTLKRKIASSKPGKDLALQFEKLGNLLLFKESRIKDAGYFFRLEALDCFTNSSNLSRDVIDLQFRVHLQKGNIYSDIGLEKDANHAYEMALSIASSQHNEALAMYHQGRSLGTFGHHHDAIALLVKSLEKSPGLSNAYLPLVQNYRALGDVSIKRWKALLKDMQKSVKEDDPLFKEDSDRDNDYSISTIDPTTRRNSDIYWAMYLVADQLEEEKLAWSYLEHAHKTHQNPNADVMNVDSFLYIRDTFKQGFWPSPPVGLDTRVPLFIVGMPQSGASLLESMLDSHGNIYGLGDDSVYAAYSGDMMKDAMIDMEVKASMKEIIHHYGNKIISTMKGVMGNDTSVSDSKKLKVKYIVDKSMSSFRSIGIIHYLFPNAVIINMMRDPMDTVLSCYTTPIIDYDTTTWDYDTDRISNEYLQYLMIIDHYRKELPDTIVDISYEQLVTQPESALHPLLTKLGLSWEADMLQFHRREEKRHVRLHSRSQWIQYYDQLLPSYIALKKILMAAQEKGLVAFSSGKNEMNWELDNATYEVSFFYEIKQKKRSLKKSTADKCLLRATDLMHEYGEVSRKNQS